MVKTLVAVLVVASVGVARAGEPPQVVDADGLPVQPPSMAQPVPPSAVQPNAQHDDEEDGTPPVSGVRLAGEVAVGLVFEAGGVLGGGFAGFELETAGSCRGEFCGLGGAVLGGLVGGTLAAPVGVYLVGNTGGETGSFGATLGGSAGATLVGLAVFAASDWHPVGGALFAAAPVVGAVIGFNATRRYDSYHRARTWAPVASAAHGTTSFGVVGRF